ncbi:hypothetical protein LMH87_001123 [Akanthomyces muscarius]|uniref:Uncharacterized protein n=1 Tax=Akanthomyces muscarius TaxID=2231603 RepID=A0A9W8UPI4_AKAMU|nr:hypothetical protein LMH87_001123 [Akanthomyces muscarius]KAJ4155900.1 hypothetical protein LMH87_001123 [Akanthomyces muscarius]
MRQKLQALIDERKKKQGSSTPRKHFRFKTAPAMDWQEESPMAIVTSAAEGAHDSAATNETNTDSEMTDSSTETALSCSKDTGDLEAQTKIQTCLADPWIQTTTWQDSSSICKKMVRSICMCTLEIADNSLTCMFFSFSSFCIPDKEW